MTLLPLLWLLCCLMCQQEQFSSSAISSNLKSADWFLFQIVGLPIGLIHIPGQLQEAREEAVHHCGELLLRCARGGHSFTCSDMPLPAHCTSW